jgi:hypothetical protein
MHQLILVDPTIISDLILSSPFMHEDEPRTIMRVPG